MKKFDFLFIGNGVASNSAAERIREKDKKSSLAIIGDEEFNFYYRPQLPDYLLERVSEEKIVIKKEDFYRSNKIELLRARSAIKIDPEAKKIWLENNEVISYSRLLISTGLAPYKSPFGFQSLLDVRRLQKISPEVEDVLVTGDYVFLLELVRALLGKNKKVTYICRGRRLLESLLDERASWYLEQLLVNQGVNLLYQTKIDKIITRADGKYSVETSYGDEASPESRGKICVDMYFIAGYEDKNRNMFIEAGLDYAEAGIWVDRFMRTSKKDIYAAGDVARVRNGYPPDVLRVGWQRAKKQGEIAGMNMLGENQEFNPFSTAIHIRFGRINFLFAGEMPPTSQSCGEDIILESVPDNSYKRVHIDEGEVKGFVFVGGTRGLARVRELLAEGTKLSPNEKFVLQKDLVEGAGDTISLQVSCPTCKTILDLPLGVEVGEKIVCEVCGAESVVSRTKVSKIKYLEVV